jgi:hypothetical protein
MGVPPQLETEEAAAASMSSSSWVDYIIDGNKAFCGIFESCGSQLVGVADQSTFLRRRRGGLEGCSETLRCASSSGGRSNSLSVAEFADAHDALMDSLLSEARRQQQHVYRRTSGDTGCSTLTGSSGDNVNSSISSTHSSVPSWTFSPTSSMSSSEGSTRKRRRPLVTLSSSARRALNTTIHLEDLDTKACKSPQDFLHPQCRLQKDKGKGEEVGSNICAKGIHPCLAKLRAKIHLLVTHCDPKNVPNTTATMKRKPAIVSADFSNFTETRSLLTLRLGFLSMTYGILLRWDKSHTEKVVLVVLRKNCHDSFYGAAVPPRLATPPALASITPTSSFEEENNDLANENQRRRPHPPPIAESGLEVALLTPPFLVSRPLHFPPSQISVAISYASKLSNKSHWTIQLALADQVENVVLTYDKHTDLFLPKLGSTLKYEFGEKPIDDELSLEIKVLEHMRRKSQRILRASMRVPTESLDPSPNANSKPMSLRIPCPDGATIFLEVSVISERIVWERAELEARRQRAAASQSKKSSLPFGVVRPPATSSNPTVMNMDQDRNDEDHSSPWSWLCMVC